MNHPKQPQPGQRVRVNATGETGVIETVDREAPKFRPVCRIALESGTKAWYDWDRLEPAG